MNKIVIENSLIKDKTIDDTIKINYSVNDTFLAVNNLEIFCLKDTGICIYYTNDNDIKFNVVINCLESVNVNLFEFYSNGILKIRNTYNLSRSSNLTIQKFYDIKEINQFDIINMNGEYSSINYILKTVSKNSEKYNLLINHNAKNTSSNVINNAVNINNGKIIFDVTGLVPKTMSGSTLNQNNRIVSFNQNKCQINPNLLIDEDDVSANHSAFVGQFSYEELFYLQSRGIRYDDALKLLIRGFLFNNLMLNDDATNSLELIIKKYWG